MIFVPGNDPVEVWEQAFVLLYRHGQEVQENRFYRNQPAALEILDTENFAERHSPYFPMPQTLVHKISTYFATGDFANGIEESHGHTKLYRDRMCSEPNQLEAVIRTLTKWPDCPRAQISFWDPTIDLERDRMAPCLQILWFKIIACRLDVHAHMRTSDCYGKLLMNIRECLAVQEFVAKKLRLQMGAYRQFIDSLHFHSCDADKVDSVFEELSNARTNP